LISGAFFSIFVDVSFPVFLTGFVVFMGVSFEFFLLRKEGHLFQVASRHPRNLNQLGAYSAP